MPFLPTGKTHLGQGRAGRGQELPLENSGRKFEKRLRDPWGGETSIFRIPLENLRHAPDLITLSTTVILPTIPKTNLKYKKYLCHLSKIERNLEPIGSGQ